jgi:hypothetical protein
MSQFNGIEKVRIFVFRGGDIERIYYIQNGLSVSRNFPKTHLKVQRKFQKFEK